MTHLEVLATAAAAVFLAGGGAGYWWSWFRCAAYEEGYEDAMEDAQGQAAYPGNRTDPVDRTVPVVRGVPVPGVPLADPELAGPSHRVQPAEGGLLVAPIRDEDDPHYWYPGNQAALRQEARPRTVIDWSVLPVLERVTLETWDWARRGISEAEQWSDGVIGNWAERMATKQGNPAWPSRDDLARLDAQVRELVAS
jgi:hypothetical protein